LLKGHTHTHTKSIILIMSRWRNIIYYTSSSYIMFVCLQRAHHRSQETLFSRPSVSWYNVVSRAVECGLVKESKHWWIHSPFLQTECSTLLFKFKNVLFNYLVYIYLKKNCCWFTFFPGILSDEYFYFFEKNIAWS